MKGLTQRRGRIRVSSWRQAARLIGFTVLAPLSVGALAALFLWPQTAPQDATFVTRWLTITPILAAIGAGPTIGLMAGNYLPNLLITIGVGTGIVCLQTLPALVLLPHGWTVLVVSGGIFLCLAVPAALGRLARLW